MSDVTLTVSLAEFQFLQRLRQCRNQHGRSQFLVTVDERGDFGWQGVGKMEGKRACQNGRVDVTRQS